MTPENLEKILAVKEMGIIGEENAPLNLPTLTGIEYFSNLEALGVGFTTLTTLDVSHNTALTNLNCSGQKNEAGESQTLTLKPTQSQYDKNTGWYSKPDVTPQVVGSPTQL